MLICQNFFTLVQETRKSREREPIQIIDYSPEFHNDFKRLNYEWIEKYFEIEDADRYSLNNPDEKILNLGGHIYMALSNAEVVGTCALIKVDDDTYELAKMAVAETCRGNGIGWLLGKAAIEKARELGAKTVFLESNTVLKPAISLYQKLGFQKTVRQPSPYARCNIQMELAIARSIA